jgi:hypothetical protein
MTPISVTNLIYSKEDGSAIDCVVVFEELADKFPGGLPFTATPDDAEQHGKDIYAKAIAGEYGDIAAWVPPTVEELAALARMQRDMYLTELDGIVMNPLRYAAFSDEYKAALAVYRQALLNVPEQEGFPQTFTFPTMPQP